MYITNYGHKEAKRSDIIQERLFSRLHVLKHSITSVICYHNVFIRNYRIKKEDKIKFSKKHNAFTYFTKNDNHCLNENTLYDLVEGYT